MKQGEITTKRKVGDEVRELTYPITEFETLREATDACDGDKRLVAVFNWGWEQWLRKRAYALLGKNTPEEARKLMASVLPPGDLPQTQLELLVEGYSDLTDEDLNRAKLGLANEFQRRAQLTGPTETAQ